MSLQKYAGEHIGGPYKKLIGGSLMLTDYQQPTLDILRESECERYWENLLVYFLNPESPHEFDAESDAIATRTVERGDRPSCPW